MSRSNQYIGMHKKAREFYNHLKQTGTVSKAEYIIAYQAFGDDPITGREEIKIDDRIYREVLQCDPWSSGPMFFTCIGVYNLENKLIGYLQTWELDENVKGEVDYENGKYYV